MGGLVLVALVAVVVVSILRPDSVGREVVGIGDGSTLEIGPLTTTALPALNLEDATRQWEVVLGAPALDFGALDGVAYVTTGEFGEQGGAGLALLAYDLDAGEQLWRRELRGDGGAVVVEAGSRSLALRADGGGPRGEDSHSRVTVVTRDGEERWSERFEDYYVPLPEVLPGGRLLLQHQGERPRSRIVGVATGASQLELPGQLLALGDGLHVLVEDEWLVVTDAAGERQWSRRASRFPAVALGDGLVFLADEDQLVALDAADGQRRWAASLNENPYNLFHVPGEGVVAQGAEDVEAFGLDGEQRWQRSGQGSMTLLRRDGRFELLRIEETMGASDEHPVLELIDATSGTGLEQRSLHAGEFVQNVESSTPGTPVTADGVLVRGQEASLRMMRFGDLREGWAFPGTNNTDTYVRGSAAVSEGIMLVYVDYSEEPDTHRLAVFR